MRIGSSRPDAHRVPSPLRLSASAGERSGSGVRRSSRRGAETRRRGEGGRTRAHLAVAPSARRIFPPQRLSVTARDNPDSIPQDAGSAIPPTAPTTTALGASPAVAPLAPYSHGLASERPWRRRRRYCACEVMPCTKGRCDQPIENRKMQPRAAHSADTMPSARRPHRPPAASGRRIGA